MAPHGQRIFLTGASGFIGGEVLHRIVLESQLKHATIRCLVRSEEKASLIRKLYHNVHVTVGDLDDTETVKREAQNSDVVLHLASTRHVPSTQAIAEGLKQRAAENSKNPAFWIQISGATLVAVDEIREKRFGEHSDKVWDGLKDRVELNSLIRNTGTRVVENLVLDSATDNLRVALIPGPWIYGFGSGPINQRSIQAPSMTQYILNRGSAFKILNGQNRWSTIHVSDLGELISKLVSTTLDPDVHSNLFNEHGIFLAETGIANFADVARWIAEEATKQNHINDSETVITIDGDGADQVCPHGSLVLGTNAIFDFGTAQKVPGWSPQHPSLKDTIAELVKSEASRRHDRK